MSEVNFYFYLHLGTFGMTYTWSVDLYKSLKYYTNYFNGIITNYPGALTGNQILNTASADLDTQLMQLKHCNGE